MTLLTTGVVNILMLIVFCLSRLTFEIAYNYLTRIISYKALVDLHLSKALFSLDPDILQLHCFSGLRTLFCCSFFCPLSITIQYVGNGSGRP